MLEELERSEVEAQRLEKALARVRIVGDDGAAAERALPEESVGGSNNATSTGSLARKSGGGLLTALTHTFHGIVDNDPEASRRSSIGKTRESIHEVGLILRVTHSDN